MGKSSTPKREETVVIERNVRGSKVGSSPDSKEKDLCLFNFRFQIEVLENISGNISSNNKVVLVPESNDKIGIFINDRRVGFYTGTHESRLKECIKQGYVYEGVASSKGGNLLEIRISGFEI